MQKFRKIRYPNTITLLYILSVSFNILICYLSEYPPMPPMSGGVGGVGGNDTDGPEAASPPPVVRNRLCWPGGRRWNKNQLLTPLMRRFDRAAAATSRNRREPDRTPSRRNGSISKDTIGQTIGYEWIDHRIRRDIL
jgi:hypothetical protein